MGFGISKILLRRTSNLVFECRNNASFCKMQVYLGLGLAKMFRLQLRYSVVVHVNNVLGPIGHTSGVI